MSKKKRKRVNPNRKTASEAFIKRAANQAAGDSFDSLWVIILSVLKDKFGSSDEDIAALWTAVEDRCQTISKGYATIADYRAVLKSDYKLTYVNCRNTSCVAPKPVQSVTMDK